ncbi:hypothetical protein [Brumicola nitratireducens]|uniref:Uncharacterized protein n=1 Tax=Glaciecola nitratireducens (strain JCM 12485 / KCTC 12276 / FR1064) TaxID=1085623 RepID=G4QGG9_GLANF|nr:hypothetical protein [Glaciecola nitratireducens]AEP29494.1 hypothetical protein GNIT_1370 [Glaciecola nitratireducens FR1064]
MAKRDEINDSLKGLYCHIRDRVDQVKVAGVSTTTYTVQPIVKDTSSTIPNEHNADGLQAKLI